MALFKQIFANDPNNPQNVAENGVISIFAPGTRDLIPIRTVTGGQLSNPLQLNSRGFGPAFEAPGFTQVAWEAIAPGEVFQGTFESYEGIFAEVVAARAAMEGALTDSEVSAAFAAASAAAAEESRQLALAPTDAQVAEAVRRAGRPSGLALAPDGIPYVLEGANDTSVYVAADGNFYFNNL